VKGVAEANDVTQEAGAALARNAQKRLFALLCELTSLAEAADAAPELPGIAETLRLAVAHALGDNPGVAFFLWDAVSAAFDIGRLLPRDPASQKKLHMRRQRMQHARGNRYPPESAEINQKIALLSKQGQGFMSDGELAKLVERSKNAVKKRRMKMKRAGEI
jgi:hypothetical protein